MNYSIRAVIALNLSYQEAFDTVKFLVCTDTTTLRYFNVHKPITIQIDASWKGLGATLLQGGLPVVFVPKVITPSKH